MKPKEVCKLILVFFTGLWARDFVWHFRLNNSILLKEILIELNQGNGYFLEWAMLGLPLIGLLWLMYFIVLLVEKKKEDGR